MNFIYSIQKTLKVLYGRNSRYLDIIIKFILSFVAFYAIGNEIGQIKLLTNIGIIAAIAVVCALLPRSFILLFSSALILAHSSKISIPITGIIALVIAVLFILYLKFSIKLAYLVILTPLFFAFKIPFALPIVVGIVTTPASFVSIICGTVMYYIVSGLGNNMHLLSNSKTAMMDQAAAFMTKVVLNKTMIGYILLLTLTVMIVYRIRTLDVNYAREIAIGSGAACLLIGTVVLKTMLHTKISFVTAIIGIAIGVVVAIVAKVLVANVDYKKVRKVQYEDDEYFYYVKAVPKVLMEDK